VIDQAVHHAMAGCAKLADNDAMVGAAPELQCKLLGDRGRERDVIAHQAPVQAESAGRTKTAAQWC
jgi:hypothetical protein